MKFRVEILTDTQNYVCFMEKELPIQAWQETQENIKACMPFIGIEGLFSIEEGSQVKHILVKEDNPAVEVVEAEKEAETPISRMFTVEDYVTYLGVKVKLTLVNWDNLDKLYILPLFIDDKPAYDEADPETIRMLTNLYIEKYNSLATFFVIELPPQQLPDIEEAEAWLKDKYPVKTTTGKPADDAKAWQGWKEGDN